MARERRVIVVIPAFNAARYLGEALESVRGQTEGTAEILVVDDGSTDDTRAWQSRVTAVRWVVQPHAGAAAARNSGAALATSDYLAFLDANDRWASDKLARQFRSPEWPHRADLRVDTEPMPAISPGTLLIPRRTLERAGPFDVAWRVGEFIDWYARAQAMGLQSVTCPEVILERRVHDDNLGIRGRAGQADNVRILKAALDRRRKAGTSE